MITHQELCRLTANRCLKRFDVVLCDYQTMISSEHPDVLAFNGHSTLFEIKVSRQDFLKDSKKDCRQKMQMLWGNVKAIENKMGNITGISMDTLRRTLTPFYREYPHLGRYRYYVCETGLISPDEIDSGFGLFWVKNNRFSLKKESEKFRNNLFLENQLLIHALRKVKNKPLLSDQILARSY